MEVVLRPLDDDLEVGQPFEAVGDRRHAGGELAGVGDDRVVAGQLVAVGGDVSFETRAADLLFPLDQHLDVDRQRAGRLEPGLHRLEVGEHLALVVGGPARIEVAVADGRLERGRQPGPERLGGLDVVVPIDEEGRLAGRVQALGIDEGVPRGLDEVGVEATGPEVVADELGRATGVGVVVRLGADGRDADEGLELLLEVGLVGFEVSVHLVDRHDVARLRTPRAPGGAVGRGIPPRSGSKVRSISGEAPPHDGPSAKPCRASRTIRTVIAIKIGNHGKLGSRELHALLD